MNYLSLRLIIPLSLFISASLQGQDLFTSALSEADNGGILNINGYTRGTIYGGLDKVDNMEIKSGYGEAALQLSAKPGTMANAYADIRFKSGIVNGEKLSNIDIREAYADIYLGRFDLRIGKQIKVWGRADAFNPTNNLIPEDFFNRSPVQDDRRLGNFMITGRYTPVSFIRLELDWVPFYRNSIYRYDLLDLPEYVFFTEGELPGGKFGNGSFGAKADFIFSKMEGSLSFFNGYDPMMGLVPGTLPMPPFDNFEVELLTKEFRQTTYGGDFAVNLGKFGLRGEIAWKITEEDDENIALPMEELSWAAGIDRSVGHVRLLLEYYGKKMIGFQPLDMPPDFDPGLLEDMNNWPLLAGMMDKQIGYYNRVLYDQTDEWIHSLLLRPSISILHETLDIEFTCLYNFTTGEYMLRPLAKYLLADGIEITAGYEHYYGEKNTRFDWISNVFSGPFAEVRISF